jgi:hypothetical protein
MASDQVRQASKVLGPLLRRRGTTPEVGAALRRALQALDKSLGGLLPQAQDEMISAGIAELRGCIDLCEKSARPADHEQLAGLKQALALVAPAAPAELPIPPPELQPTTAQNPLATTKGGPAPAGRKTRRPQGPSLACETASTLLAGLAAKLQSLHVVLTGSLYRLADRYEAQAELEKHIAVLKWQGRERIPDLLRVADVAKDAEDRLTASAALVYLGEARGAEMMMGILGQAVAAGQPLPATSATLLRTLADASVLDWLLKVFLRPAHPAVGGLLLPLLAERKLLSSAQLAQLANHAKDEIAVAAAQALPWTDGDADVPRLLSWAQLARTPERTNALLCAATVLGSTAALHEVRARLQGGDHVDQALVDALAAAGGPADATVLLGLAARPDVAIDADYLVLAAASLGSAETLSALPALSDLVSPRVLAEVRRMLTGSVDEDHRPLDASVRILRGEPWSLAGLLACLGEPGESLEAQHWLALELRARTGQAPLGTLPLLLPAEVRPELLAHWQAYYAKANGRLPPGHWYFQGKSLARASA